MAANGRYEDSDDASSDDETFHGVGAMQNVHGAEMADQEYHDEVYEDLDFPKMAWDEDKPLDHGISARAATSTLTAAIIGAGVMALAALPKAGGYYLSLFLMTVGCAATMEAGSGYFKGVMAHNMYHKDDPSKQISTYEDFAFHAIGPKGPPLIQTFIIIWFFGCSCGYYILMANNMRALFMPLWDASYQTWVCIMVVPLGFLCMLRDMSAISKLMPVATGAAILSCVLIMAKSTQDVNYWHDWPEEDIAQIHNLFPSGGIMPIGSLLATLFGAFGSIPCCPPILDEMKQQRKFMRSLRSALSLCFGMYLGVMVLGYNGYGNFILPNIADSMMYHPANLTEALFNPGPDGFREWTGRQSQAFVTSGFTACVLINLVLSYPLLMVTMFISIASAPWTKGKMPPGSNKNYVLRVSMVLGTFIVALFIQDFGTLFGLFASLCAPLLNQVFPLWFGHLLRKNVKAKGSGCFRLIWHGIIYLMSVFAMIFGCIDSVNGLRKMFA